MRQQGCCTLPPDESGRVLDRLAGLEKVIPLQMIRQALNATGRVNTRACKLTHEVMLGVVLAMGLLTHLPIRQVFKHCRRFRKGEYTPCRSSLCEARQRLGLEPVKYLHKQVVQPLATADTPGAFFRGLRLMAFDGTVLDVPDSEANTLAFGRSSGSRGEGAFPQVRKVSLVELGTHVEVAIAIGGWQDDERTLARQLWNDIPSDALLLEDRGFFSFEDWKDLNSPGKKLFVRVKNQMILKPISKLSDGSYLAKIYESSWNREKDRHGIIVRVICFTLDDPRRVGHGEEHRFITNLLDEKEYPALEMICAYHERWEEELTFDEQKTHQDPCRAEKPANLRSETPAGVKQELYALSLGHFIVRSLMLEAANEQNLDVDRLSFTGSFRILQCRLPECVSQIPQLFSEWKQNLIWEIGQEKIEPRRNRINPRVIKRKMSKWPKKRAHHRNPPQPTKPFADTIVMTV